MAGRVATRILNHSCHTSGRWYLWRASVVKGHSRGKYSTTTARMAPSWMTTRNMLMNSSE